MANICTFCGAEKFVGEKTLCCKDGRLCSAIVPFPNPPPQISNLLFGNDRRSQHFRTLIRVYNSTLSFTSMNANYDRDLANATHGTVTHLISNFSNHSASFGNVYLHDAQEQERIRLNQFDTLDREILRILQNELHTINPFVHLYQQVGESVRANPRRHLTLRLIGDPRVGNYNLPTTDEIAMIIGGDLNNNLRSRELHITYRNRRNADETLHLVKDTSQYYDPLQYVLMFPYGTLGWHFNLRDSNGGKLSPLDFYRFQFFTRLQNHGPVFFGRLFLQYAVDQAVKMEQQRLKFIELNQDRIHADNYDLEPGTVILPSTFTMSPRYMQQIYLDAMAIVKT